MCTPNTATFVMLLHNLVHAGYISILFASEDGGVSPADSCTTFIGTFPSWFPYVTSVGGPSTYPRQPPTSLVVGSPTTELDLLFRRRSGPRVQPSDAGLHNASGQGDPDVAAYAVEFYIAVKTLQDASGGRARMRNKICPGQMKPMRAKSKDENTTAHEQESTRSANTKRSIEHMRRT
ncbi:hypothetical protein DAEQUDRAFT_723877 [Daedalea quercina L-15889]|uniref:Uncharacterized protein n=1 Tax=Daedalea quercina L-15889 TaxID=1314783 RepID=A0A165SC39_9APHY|nr:hypothetical protein DAEQUDRAFT_723877 [Daedalea quercina L-15889]